MRQHPNQRIEEFRTEFTGLLDGVFTIPHKHVVLRAIATTHNEWDHVSVSIKDAKRTPTWEEMAFVKDLFFRTDEPVFQFHPPVDEYVNLHPFCLHLWRPQNVTFPRPPMTLVF